MTVSQTIPDHVREAAIEAARDADELHRLMIVRVPERAEFLTSKAMCKCGEEFGWQHRVEEAMRHSATAQITAALNVVSDSLRKYSEVVLSGRYIPVYMWREGVGE